MRHLLTRTNNKLKIERVAAFQFGKVCKSIYAILLRIIIIPNWEKFKSISNLALSGHPIIFTQSDQGQYQQCLEKKKNHHRKEATLLRYRPDSLTSMTILKLILMTVERQGSLSKGTQWNHLELLRCFWMNHKTLTVNSSGKSESICSTGINQQDKDSNSPHPPCSREEEKLSCDLNSKIECPPSSVKWSSAVKRLEQYSIKTCTMKVQIFPQCLPILSLRRVGQ